jgi:hypothetical protein
MMESISASTSQSASIPTTLSTSNNITRPDDDVNMAVDDVIKYSYYM